MRGERVMEIPIPTFQERPFLSGVTPSQRDD
jgi:hypothetical protein